MGNTVPIENLQHVRAELPVPLTIILSVDICPVTCHNEASRVWLFGILAWIDRCMVLSSASVRRFGFNVAPHYRPHISSNSTAIYMLQRHVFSRIESKHRNANGLSVALEFTLVSVQSIVPWADYVIVDFGDMEIMIWIIILSINGCGYWYSAYIHQFCVFAHYNFKWYLRIHCSPLLVSTVRWYGVFVFRQGFICPFRFHWSLDDLSILFLDCWILEVLAYFEDNDLFTPVIHF